MRQTWKSAVGSHEHVLAELLGLVPVVHKAQQIVQDGRLILLEELLEQRVGRVRAIRALHEALPMGFLPTM